MHGNVSLLIIVIYQAHFLNQDKKLQDFFWLAVKTAI